MRTTQNRDDDPGGRPRGEADGRTDGRVVLSVGPVRAYVTAARGGGTVAARARARRQPAIVEPSTDGCLSKVRLHVLINDSSN